jgi:hypothetical protein
VYLNAETIDKLSIPCGMVLGPITVAYNLIKLANDIAKITYYSFLNRNYIPSEAYHLYKLADLGWEAQVSRQYKPRFNNDGTFVQDNGLFSDPIGAKIVSEALANPLVSCGLISVYKDLSEGDKLEVELENAKRDFFQHVSLISKGIILSIPILGGALLYLVNIKVIKI